MYGVLDRAFGLAGIRLFTALVAASLAATLFRIALRLTVDPLRAAIVTMTALAVSAPLWNQRPLLLGALCFTLLVLIFGAPGRLTSHAGQWLLVPLFWFWGNVHGSWVLGALFVALHTTGTMLDARQLPSGRDRSLLIGAIVGVITIVANPYGFEMLTFPIKLVAGTPILVLVPEWRSPSFNNLVRWPFLVWVGVLAVGIGRRWRPPWSDVIVAVVFSALGFWAVRNLVIAPIATLPIVARSFARTPGTTPRLAIPRRADLAIALALTAAFIAITIHALGTPNFDPNDYPVAAMRAADRHGLIGKRLVTRDKDAAYVEIKYWPRQRIFFDDRYDMYPTWVGNDYRPLLTGGPGWNTTLDRVGAEVVVWPTDTPSLSSSPKTESGPRSRADNPT